MESIENKAPDNLPTRRKFVWGVGVISVCAAAAASVGIPFFNKKNVKVAQKKQVVKMLTEDGRLVEIDGALLSASRKKITNSELQNWIKK